MMLDIKDCVLLQICGFTECPDDKIQTFTNRFPQVGLYFVLGQPMTLGWVPDSDAVTSLEGLGEGGRFWTGQLRNLLEWQKLLICMDMMMMMMMTSLRDEASKWRTLKSCRKWVRKEEFNANLLHLTHLFFLLGCWWLVPLCFHRSSF